MKIFLDANILLDNFDKNRPFSKYSSIVYRYMVENKFKLFTSCDLITTIYYINAKQNRKKALENIRDTNKILKVIEFSNKEIEETCELMINDNNYKDLEDTIQYIMAKKENCDLIISNDKNFISKDIKLLTSEEFYKQYVEGQK